MAIGSHHSHRVTKDEWITPKWVTDALGPFDLDPCTPHKRLWDTAKLHYSENGLTLPWNGRVWLNPPYSHKQVWEWLKRLYEHGNGIAIIFARTETEGFFRWVWDKATALLFIKGRLTFLNADGSKPIGNSGGPSVLVAYGHNNKDALRYSGIEGKLIVL